MAFGIHFSRGLCHQGIFASLPTPAHAKMQRCGVAMTCSGQGETTCPPPVWQWQGGHGSSQGLWSDCCLPLAWLVSQWTAKLGGE